MSQFIVLGSYCGSSESYEYEATCTGRKLPIAEVKERGLSFAGRRSYARWSEGEGSIRAASWLYSWYEVKPGDTITLSSIDQDDWNEEKNEPKQERLAVTVSDDGLPHPPSTLEEMAACDQHNYYGLVSRGESIVLESVTWGIGGLMRDAKLSADQCAALVKWLVHDTGVAQEYITIDGDERVVTFRHGTPMTVRETLLRQLHQALKRVDRRWYPVLVS
jgi:hypothetical protein